MCWHELQQPLRSAASWPELAALHAQYLTRAMYRCFLDAKMAPVHKVLHNLFALILEFKQHALALDLDDLVAQFDAESAFAATQTPNAPAFAASARQPSSLFAPPPSSSFAPSSASSSSSSSSSSSPSAAVAAREASFTRLQSTVARFRQHADFLYRVLRQLGMCAFGWFHIKLCLGIFIHTSS